jgi:hypothetical protein
MNSQGLTPFFDGHNDVLLRLFKREGRDAPRADTRLAFTIRQRQKQPRSRFPTDAIIAQSQSVIASSSVTPWRVPLKRCSSA